MRKSNPNKSSIKSKVKCFLRKNLIQNLPKTNRVILIDSMNAETNAIAMANHIAEHYNMPVSFVVKHSFKKLINPLLNDKVKLVTIGSLKFNLTYLTSKYILSTHGFLKTPKSQIHVNLWHGVGHKKIKAARGYGGVQADITVATSELTQNMFSNFFEVPIDSVFISGYPRNDIMLKAKREKKYIINQIDPDLNSYSKIILWMPTYRRMPPGIDVEMGENGIKLDNIFNSEGFDVSTFNNILKKHNAICILKPHYYYDTLSKKNIDSLSNILMINDQWILNKKITLYHLIGCTDMLITDFSSVMTDFSLLDKPIICFCTDLDKVKNNEELYFEDIENWLPSKLYQNQGDFFEFLNELLTTDHDPYVEKRVKMRNLYFKYRDDKSAERLANFIFSSKKN